jgi:hypothetical protein
MDLEHAPSLVLKVEGVRFQIYSGRFCMLMRRRNTKSIVKVLAVFISFFSGYFFLSEPSEAMRIETTWGERVTLSEKIVRGRVIDMKSHWNRQKTLIHTDVTVLVDEYLKGGGPREIVIKVPGGTVDDQTQSVSDTPQFVIGDEYVIFLDSHGGVTGGPDGIFALSDRQGDAFLVWLRAYLKAPAVKGETSGQDGASNCGPCP